MQTASGLTIMKTGPSSGVPPPPCLASEAQKKMQLSSSVCPRLKDEAAETSTSPATAMSDNNINSFKTAKI